VGRHTGKTAWSRPRLIRPERLRRAGRRRHGRAHPGCAGCAAGARLVGRDRGRGMVRAAGAGISRQLTGLARNSRHGSLPRRGVLTDACVTTVPKAVRLLMQLGERFVLVRRAWGRERHDPGRPARADRTRPPSTRVRTRLRGPERRPGAELHVHDHRQRRGCKRASSIVIVAAPGGFQRVIGAKKPVKVVQPRRRALPRLRWRKARHATYCSVRQAPPPARRGVATGTSGRVSAVAEPIAEAA
jgi:hypothetical protein